MKFKASDLPAAIGSFLAAVLVLGALLYFMVREIQRPGAPTTTPHGAARAFSPSTVLDGAGTLVRGTSPVPVVAGESPGDITRCEVAGKVVYSNVTCGKNARQVDVFVNQGFDSSRTSVPAEIRRSPAVETAEVTAAESVSSEEAVRPERCRWIEEAIKDNEATARLPQTPQRQDWLTAEKRRLLAEKEALKC